MIQTHLRVHKQELVDRIALYLDKEIQGLNYKVTLSNTEIFELTGLIIDKYQYETFEDIVLAWYYFKQGKLSIKASDTYRISVPVCIEIMDAYMMEHKIPAREQYHSGQSSFSKEEKQNPLSYAELAKRAREAINEMTLRKHSKKSEERGEIQKSALNDYGEFEKIAIEQLSEIPTEEMGKYLMTFPYSQREILKKIAKKLISERRK